MIMLMKKIWSFMRHHAVIIILGVILVGALLGGLIMKNRAKDAVTTLWDMIKKERALHAEKVTKIDEINKTEIASREKAADKAIDAIKQAEEQYRKNNIKLDEKKKKEITALVKKSDSEEALAKKLAEQFNFRYVSSKE